MKTIARKIVFLAIFLTGLSSSKAHAQVPVDGGCGSDGGRSAMCRSHGCFGTYSASAGSGSDYEYGYQPALCCGQTVQVVVETGNCPDAALRTKEAHQFLAMLASAGTQLMIRGCQGHFSRYVPPAIDLHYFEAIRLDSAGL